MITVAERRRLEDLIYAAEDVVIEWTCAHLLDNLDEDAAVQQKADARQALRAYLDELTDYATYEARDTEPTGLLAG